MAFCVGTDIVLTMIQSELLSFFGGIPTGLKMKQGELSSLRRYRRNKD